MKITRLEKINQRNATCRTPSRDVQEAEEMKEMMQTKMTTGKRLAA